MAGAARQFALLTLVSGLLFLTNLGVAPLWDEDEPIFAGAAQEMLQRGEWVVPYFNGQMLPDKPALMYWVMLASYRWFGVNEWAARLGPAIFAWGLVLLTWQFGRKLFSPAVGVWAGVILASSLGFDVVARAATPDTLLAFFSGLALMTFVYGASSKDGSLLTRTPSQAMFAASYAAMGFAALAKGPIGVLLPTATIGLFWLVAAPEREHGLIAMRTLQLADAGRLAKWRARATGWLGFLRAAFAPRRFLATVWRMRPLTAAACVAAIAGPWYGAVGARTGGQWLAGFLGVHNLGRFLHPMEHHRGPIFYYLIAVSIGFFPWSLFFAPTIARIRTQLAAAGARRPAYVFLCCWIAVYLGFFSLAATKLPNYIVPLYPALALLTAAWLHAWLSDTSITPARKLRPAWIVLGLAGVGVAGGLPLTAKLLVDGPWTVGLVAIPLLAAAIVCWQACEQGRARRVAIVFCAAAILFHVTLFGWAALVVGRRQNSQQFAAAIHQNSGDSEPVIRSFGYYRPSLVFYAKHPVWQLVADEQVYRFFEEHPRDAFLVTTGDRYERLAAGLPSDVHILERGRWFLRSKQLLLLGRPQHLASATSTWEKSGWRPATQH